MPLITAYRTHRCDLQANPNVLYVFGDNEERVGYGGQAGEMRDEPNAAGIATLSFRRDWSDIPCDVWRQCAVIRRDFIRVEDALRARRLVVWPHDGIGTGIARLPEVSPRTFNFIQLKLKTLKESYSL